MYKLFLLAPMLILSSCGVYKWFHNNGDNNSRQVASLSVQQLLMEKKSNFNESIDEKLQSLHSYYLIGQKNLLQFDAQLANTNVEDLYESAAYLNLLAVRTQTEEIEHELVDLWQALQKDKSKASLKLALQIKISSFAKQSKISSLSMENLSYQLGLSIPSRHDQKLKGALTSKEIENEYKMMEPLREFMVYEKNIEHLSHMMDIKANGLGKKFYPSTSRPGNITGNEFPAKVWALTFDDGPGKSTSSIIVKNLKQRNLKATFFQLTQKAKALPREAREIKDAGMEIASHSYTHKQLTKVGALALEKEITQAYKELEEAHDVKIKFFRLPYGAGVGTSHIREKIAGNGLIHVFWNIDTLDWMAQEPQKIVERTIALMKKTSKDAGVILFHDIHRRTAEATPAVMDFLKKDERRVCTLDEIVTQINEGAEKVCP